MPWFVKVSIELYNVLDANHHLAIDCAVEILYFYCISNRHLAGSTNIRSFITTAK